MLNVEKGEVLKVTYTDNPETAETSKRVVTSSSETVSSNSSQYSESSASSKNDYVPPTRTRTY